MTTSAIFRISEETSLTKCIGPARASFAFHTTGGAHVNVWQEGKNGRFYEAKVALHFDL